MRIAIMQPGYLPWLGFFEMMHKCELFVIFDDVQYTKKDWRSRNKIRTKEGWMWLSVPVQTKNKRFQMINEAKIDYSYGWQHKHLKAIEINYQKAHYFSKYFPCLRHIIGFKWQRILDLDIELIKWMAWEIGIKREMVMSSSFKTSGKLEDKIISLCQSIGAEELYDTKASSTFLDIMKFDQHGIKIDFQDYKHPVYEQVYCPFLPYMSALDILFNQGARSTDIILGSKD